MKAIKIIAVVMMVGGATGCSDEHPTYTIYKDGDHFTDRKYDVIRVYGFGNNDLLADEIVKMLNKEEPNKYSYELD